MIELVRVDLKPAVRRFLEREGEGVEAPARPAPDVAVAALLQRRSEGLAGGAPQAAVGAVGEDRDVGARNIGGGCFRFEPQIDLEFARAFLQDRQQPLARDAGESLTAGADRPPAIVDVDVVPMHEIGHDPRVGRRIGRGDIAECLIGEHDAPAERVVGSIPLENRDGGSRNRRLQDDREEQSRRPPTDADDPHGSSSRRDCLLLQQI